ncbi:MAG: ABC transporter ATP-binding protein [Ardenticatenia bacterium]|nr:ABC transporter ATP-binding protein [Ardenticatenia bacterium]
MSDVAIDVTGLGKRYRIGSRAPAPRGRWDALRQTVGAPFAYLRQSLREPTEAELLHALRDVSFQVRAGEVLGLIGRNGAGKSTLLKILARITEPSSGRAELHGRVGSLLEVGTGFHPELSGRENIYLNGAILGMRRAEIQRRFDEIVAFSGVERFLDTPVKRYSSGMYVRLAFSVAAHLESEILLMDEVLAVGDGDFQKKCLGKVQEIAGHGRTVLFVSHNMGMITSLCQSALLLEGGRVAASGPASEVVSRYFHGERNTPYLVDYRSSSVRRGDDLATLLEASVRDPHGRPTADIDIRSAFTVTMHYTINQAVSIAPFPQIQVYDTQGACVFVSFATSTPSFRVDAGDYVATCHIPGNLLNNGTYYIGIALTFRHLGIHTSFIERDALAVNMIDPIHETIDEDRMGYGGIMIGMLRPKLDWTIERTTK